MVSVGEELKMLVKEGFKGSASIQTGANELNNSKTIKKPFDMKVDLTSLGILGGTAAEINFDLVDSKNMDIGFVLDNSTLFLERVISGKKPEQIGYLENPGIGQLEFISDGKHLDAVFAGKIINKLPLDYESGMETTFISVKTYKAPYPRVESSLDNFRIVWVS